jgi:VCBS repeat-containing protein
VLPDAVDDSAGTGAGAPVVINPLANDSDPIGAGIAVTAVGAAANGTVQQTGNQFTYTPDAGFSGEDAFTYTIGLTGGGSDTATVTVNVAAAPDPNDPPVAGTDAVTTGFDIAIVIPAAQLLSNDSDLDGDALAVTGIELQGAGGVAAFDSGTGAITYTPNAGFSGPDTFAYSLTDGTVSVAGLVNVTVAPVPGENDAPVANDDSASGDEDDSLTGDVLANDVDLDSANLSAILVGGPAHGALTLNADGSFTYTPDADFNGPDSFTYRANDGALDGNVATVALTVTAENDEPTNVLLTNATVAENSANGAVIGTLSATDIDGDPLAFSIVGAPGPFAVLGNELRVNGPIDFETTPTLPVTLRASDSSGASTERDFTIIVADVNEGGGGGPAPIPPGFAFSNGSQGNGQAPAGPTTTQGVGTSSNGTFLIEATGVWNSVKNAFTAVDSWSPALGTDITLANFVDVRLDLDNSGPLDLTVTAIGLKRGDIATDGGDDTINLVLHSNGNVFVNTVKVATDGGDDVVNAVTVAQSGLDEIFLSDNPIPANGKLWNRNYDGRFSTVEADLGDGDDTVTATGVRLVAKGGAGDDTLIGGRRADVLQGGDDDDILTGGSGADRFRFDGTDGTDTMTDFSAAQGDKVSIIGGTAADVTLAGNTFTFGVTIVTASNGHAFAAADFLFV